MIVKEERGNFTKVSELSSKSFEHNYAGSGYSDFMKDAYRRKFSLEWIKQHLKIEGNTRFCVIDNGTIIGTVDLHNRQRLRALYIDPDRTGEGVATMLIDAAIVYQIDVNQRSEIYAYSGAAGISFWESQGFSETTDTIGRWKGFYTLMVKSLV